MIKLDKMFPIISNGKETTAEIIGAFVYDENIYIPVIIASSDEFKVFHVLPLGIKDAGKTITEKFANVIFAKKEVNRVFE